MIRFAARNHKQKRIIVGIGLTEHDTTKLHSILHPEVVFVAVDGMKIPLPVDVVIIGGKNNQDLMRKLKNLHLNEDVVQMKE